MKRLFFEKVDWILVFALMAILAYGIYFVGTTGGSNMMLKQLGWIVIGIFIFYLVVSIDYEVFCRYAYYLYFIGIILLLVTFQFRSIKGAQSWIQLGPMRIQPSEFMKVFFVLALGKYLMYRDNYKSLPGLMTPLLLALVPMGLILKQPDFGTAMIFLPTLFIVLFAAGARIIDMFVLGLVGLATAPIFWFKVLKGYQHRRLLAFLYPDQYKVKEAWQLFYSKLWIGVGDWWGRPDLLSRLSNLPEQQSDFIFSRISFEWGFLGAALLLVLFFVLVVSALGISERTREPFGRLIAVGATALIFVQLLINAGVTVGLFPTTGITLPFVSYGGSSICTSFFAIGLVVNVGMRRTPVLGKEALD